MSSLVFLDEVYKIILLFPKKAIYFKVADPDRGSGIWCLFDPGIRDPGWVEKSRSESVMNIPDHISESLETVFGLKILKFLDADPDPGPGIFLTLYSGQKNSDH